MSTKPLHWFTAPLCLLALASAPTQAEPLGWDYASGSLLFLGKIDNGDSENIDKGFRLDYAQSFNEHFFFRAKTELQEFDEVGADTAQVGVGGRLDLQTTIPVQLWGSFNYERLSIGGVSDGFGADIGIRSEVAPDFELGLTLKTANLSGANSLDHDAIELSGAYTGLADFDIIATVNNASFDDDLEFDFDNIVGVGVRLNF